MKAEWFAAIVESWSSSGAVRARMAEQLMAIARAAGGEPIEDDGAPLEESERREWATGVALDAVQSRLNLLARRLRELRPERRFLDTGGPRGPFEPRGVERARWRPTVPLNQATAAELEALPVLGPVLAQRVVEYRTQHGPFLSLDELTRISGIASASVESLRGVLTLEAEPLIYPRIRELEDFIAAPGFERLAALVRKTGASFLERQQGAGGSEETLVQELAGVLESVTVRPPPSASHHRRTTTAVREQLELRRRGATLRQSAYQNLQGTAAIMDREYLPFARQLVAGAASSINIVMFFMRYEPTRATPLNELIDALTEAHHRGVKVQILLDRDNPDDPAKSRVVNQETFRRLRAEGVPIRLDAPERSTHSKLLIVDATQILVGSHNWTLGSMLRYDDTSIYLESESVGEAYEERFARLWAETREPVSHTGQPRGVDVHGSITGSPEH